MLYVRQKEFVPVEVEVMRGSSVLEREIEVDGELLKALRNRSTCQSIKAEVATTSVVLAMPVSGLRGDMMFGCNRLPRRLPCWDQGSVW